MQTWQIVLMVVVFVMLDIVVIGAIFAMAVKPVRALADRYPPVPPAPDAVMRRFQTFRFGMMNMGGCIHAAADEKHLHLLPARLARWFGVRPMSIPWEKVRPTGKSSRRGTEVRVDDMTITGPGWLMNLAGSTQTE